MNTTDPQDELVPIVNEKDELVGKTTRKEVTSNPNLIHRAIGILVFNSKGELLIQKRSKTKDTYPDSWTHSVAGHVRYGEAYLATALREMKEEIGVAVQPSDLTPLGKILVRSPWVNEWTQVYTFVLKNDVPFTSQNEEVSEVRFVSRQEIQRMLEEPSTPWSPPAKQTLATFLLT
jgi:isopentenyl-diphosphate Delta-isomerase